MKMLFRVIRLGIVVSIMACGTLCLLLFCVMLAFWMDYNIELLNRLAVLCDCSWSIIPAIWSRWLPAEGVLGWIQIIALDAMLPLIWWIEGMEKPMNKVIKLLKHVSSEE